MGTDETRHLDGSLPLSHAMALWGLAVLAETTPVERPREMLAHSDVEVRWTAIVVLCSAGAPHVGEILAAMATIPEPRRRTLALVEHKLSLTDDERRRWRELTSPP